MLKLEKFVRAQRKCSFETLFEGQVSKMEMIVTFLVILELMKVGKINIEQEQIFDDIIITAKEAA